MKTLISFFFCCGVLVAQVNDAEKPLQDPYFAGTHNSLLFLNPSFAGTNHGFRTQTAYKVQDRNLTRSYITWSNSAELYIKKINGAIFANWTYDDVRRGTLKTNFFTLGYAQHINVTKKVRLIPSLQITYLTRQLDIHSLYMGETPDPRYGGGLILTHLPVATKWNFEASSGLLLTTGNFYGGISLMHLNQPDVGLLGERRLPLRTNAHASYNFHFSDKTLLNIAARYSSQGAQKYSQLLVTAVTRNHLITGIGVGTADPYPADQYLPMILSVGYRTQVFTASLLYQRAVKYQFPSSVEISLSYNLRNKEARKELTNLEAW
jgi:type IX secretion system PorP/SprF family membrane protein